MKEVKDIIHIPLDHIEFQLVLSIYGDKKQSIYSIENEIAFENGEAPIQILEGQFYQYYIKLNGIATSKYQIRENVIVKNAIRKDVSEGRISPNIYVGSLQLEIINNETNSKCGETNIEVLATKLDDDNLLTEDSNYRKNYQFMLKDIADKCTELLMQINSPVTQNFQIDFNKDNETIYQRFAFVNTLINTNEFNDAIHKITSSPTTKWRENREFTDTRSVGRFNSFSIKQIASGSNRVKLTQPIGRLNDVPIKIETSQKVETTDTPENRFVKHALEVFLQFCNDCLIAFSKHNYSKNIIEAQLLIEKIESHLFHPVFKEIERPTTLKLNSTVLQRKSGYRELLIAWLQFDLAAKLIWKGGEDVYKVGKRDIAILYEYWLFFVLYDLMKSKFQLKSSNYGDLIESTADGLNVMVKSGKLTALDGQFHSDGRDLRIKFSYNRTFIGGSKYNRKNKNNSYSGSWTKALRPDYTLSIWPAEINDEEKAEELEKIVHIHFDSKYKVQQFSIQTEVEQTIIENDLEMKNSDDKIDSLEKEKRDERKGIYKNADLLKMHAYKDAIRRTGGAYVLYPGTEKHKPYSGFHEIIPGLGAFAIRPTEGENGTAELSDFIDNIILHFNNMASQQRRLSSNIYQIHSALTNPIQEPIPEYLIPHETHVIIAYYKSSEHLMWIQDRMKYNGRIGNVRGAMDLTPEFIGAQYILLHNENSEDPIIYKIDQTPTKKPSVISSQDSIFTQRIPLYPNSTNPFYLVFNLLEKETHFLDKIYDYKSLPGYSEERDAFAFTCNLAELMNVSLI
jgi:predicted component of viral defense system (DUF524 family)